MPAERNRPKRDNFNPQAQLPFQLRLEDFEIAMPPKLQSVRRSAKMKRFVLQLFSIGRLSVASKELPDQCKGFPWSPL
jgi:hypothetical protein